MCYTLRHTFITHECATPEKSTQIKDVTFRNPTNIDVVLFEKAPTGNRQLASLLAGAGEEHIVSNAYGRTFFFSKDKVSAEESHVVVVDGRHKA